MFTEKDIKPIPKYIERQIKRAYFSSYYKYSRSTCFYSYLTNIKGELALIHVAVRQQHKTLHMKQVVVHSIHSKDCYIKDIIYYYIRGYVVGWYNEGLSKYKKWYENGTWDYNDDKYFNIYAPIVNLDFISKQKKYKYSLAENFDSQHIMKYLRLYENYPQAEYLMKLKLFNLAMSKQILRKLEKDKEFRKWIIKNQNDISLYGFYISTVLYAYKHNETIEIAQRFQTFIKSFSKNENYKRIKDLFDGDIREFYDYIVKQNTNESSYIDYLDACEYLHIDMNLEKNKIPHEFKKWHDIRIDEYATAQAIADKKKRKALYNKFSKIASKYQSLERNLNEDFVVIIAKSPRDLISEGEKLQHCVGRMNYDQKFINEESLIFFIRNKDNLNTPFVTLEYSLQNHKVLQCYADNDTKPTEQVLEFVNNKWLPYANKKISKIA